MAKKNGKLIIYTVVAAISILGAYTAIVLAWGDQRTQDALLEVQITTESAAREKLETDGCKPAKEHKTQIAVIESRLDTIVEQNSLILKEIKEIRKK